MYIDYFGLRVRPFEITADPSFFYQSPCYRDAYMGLWFSVRQKKRLIVLTGGPGTGKTLLLRKAAAHLAPTHHLLSLPHYPHTLEELLTAPDLSRNGRHTEDALERTPAALLSLCHRTQETVTLFLDEAQALPSEVLEGLRQLLTLRSSAQTPLLTLVLAGDTTLETKLRRPEFQDLQQQIDTFIRLRRLHTHEIASYIAYRLRIAGREPQDVFPPEAIQRISYYSQGIPRVINLLCDNALQAAHLARTTTVAASVVDDVAKDLLLTSGSHSSPDATRMATQSTVPVTVLHTDQSIAQSVRYPVSVKRRPDQLAWVALGLLVAWLSVWQTILHPPFLARVSIPTVVPEMEQARQVEPVEELITAEGAPPPVEHPPAQLAQAPTVSPAHASGDEQSRDVTAGHRSPSLQPSTSARPTSVQASSSPTPIQLARRQVSTQPPTGKDKAMAAREAQRLKAQAQLAELGLAATETTLFDAVARGDIQRARLLLTAGVMPDAKDKDGWTPLMLAARDNQADAVALLLEHGAHVNATNKTDGTALIAAAMNDHVAVTALLLDKGARVNAKAAQGWTALTYAAWKGHRDVVDLLLHRGADAQVKDKDGWTPLMYASWRQDTRPERERLQREIASVFGVEHEPLAAASHDDDYLGVARVLAYSEATH
jgi:general secretion pathway protein A